MSAAVIAAHEKRGVTYRETVLADTPLIFSRFEDLTGTVATDISGNGANGAYQNGVLLDRPGALTRNANPGAGFDGTNDRVDFTTGLDSGNTGSIEAWFKTSATGITQTIASRWYGPTGASQRFVLRIEPTDNKCYISTRNTSNVYHQAGGGPVVTDGQWHHVVGCFNASFIWLYLDGQLIQVAARTGTVTSPATVLTVGSKSDPTDYFNGSLDEVALYAGVISAEVVRRHYLVGKDVYNPGAYSAAVMADTPLGYWRLDDATTPFLDSSGNGRSLTITGSVTGQFTGLIANSSNMSADFSGGYATMAHAAWQNPTTWTLECLYRPDTLNVDRYLIIKNDNASPITELSYQLLTTNTGKLAVSINVGGVMVSTIGATTLVAGTTYHLAATYDGTNLKVFVNGVQDGTVNAGGPYVPGTQAFSIGGNLVFSSNRADGQLDEAAIYGTALTQAQLAAHVAAMSSYAA
jgi:hypothetical protein